jgi:hypothetical protein
VETSARLGAEFFFFIIYFIFISSREGILLKVMIQTIPTYNMSILLLPKALCKNINSMLHRFWWGHKDNESKIHWMSWEKHGVSKAREGMGFRDLICFNKTLLAKQCWRLMQNKDSIASKIIMAKYYLGGTILEAMSAFMHGGVFMGPMI